MILQVVPSGPNPPKKVDCTPFQILHALYVITSRDSYTWSSSVHANHPSIVSNLVLFCILIILQFYKLHTQWVCQSVRKNHVQTFAMAPGFRTIWQSFRVNPPANIPGEHDELAGASERSDACSNKAPTPLEAPTPPLIPPPAKDLFTKFMKVFMGTTQTQALAEPWECPLKARTPETYWGKSHMECNYFCQQCEDHFETSGATGMNRTPFAASFLCGSISLRWA